MSPNNNSSLAPNPQEKETSLLQQESWGEDIVHRITTFYVKSFGVKKLNIKTTFMTNIKQHRPYPFENIQATQLAWLAGLLQAEADFNSDKRIRSKSGHTDYTPPPPIPKVKLEMVEKDLMEYVAELVGEKVVTQNRKTTANKEVYRITIQAREKTEVFLRAILPYIIGEKNRSRILDLLAVCDAYNNWLAEGGRSKAAKLAARSKKH